jgi:hypothetical protein
MDTKAENHTAHATGRTAVNGRAQLWLAPLAEQVKDGFEVLKNLFEDDQVVDGLKPVAAHLLVSMGSALGRLDEVHPAIMDMTTGDSEGITHVGTSAPDFSGGPLYTFFGSTPSDQPDPAVWRRADVDAADLKGKVPLYKYRDHRAGTGPLTDPNDKRFHVYTGRTEKRVNL